MTPDRPRILILGGYGTFGGRLARLLTEDPRLTLIIAGRSRDKAAAFCKTLPTGAQSLGAACDRDEDLETQIKALDPHLVVDAMGPFQAYGADPYRVVKACLALGLDYMDLADGSDFVKGIARFDEEARARDVFVLSGVSSFPALTAAAVRQLAEGLASIDSVKAGIAPSPHAGLGLNVIRAIAGYAGKPVPVLREGQRSVAYGFSESMRYTIAPPGHLPLRSTRFSLVDVPDLLLLPQLWPDLRSVWTGAGPTPEILHRGLNTLAGLVRLRLLPSLSFLARYFHRARNRFRWGEDRGGMFVAVEGTDEEGRKVARSWHLLAEDDDGPFVPAMPAAAIIKRCLEGSRPASGARAALQELELADFESFFARRAIHTGRREARPDGDSTSLYRRVLGDAWPALPEALRLMHDPGRDLTAVGAADVERGTGLLSQAIAELFGLPRGGRNIPVEVSFQARDQGETWRRSFADRSFQSVQSAGRGRDEALLCERFGPLTVGLALLPDEGKLRLVVRQWNVLGLPLPASWAPRADDWESAEDGRFNFHVRLSHPLTGLIVSYRGWLIPRA